MQVIYSATIKGNAVFAGGPYYCSKGDIMTAITTCLNNPKKIKLNEIDQVMHTFENMGLIDKTYNLKSRKTFAFTGSKDPVVMPEVSKFWSDLMRDHSHQVRTVFNADCGHAFPTNDTGNEK